MGCRENRRQGRYDLLHPSSPKLPIGISRYIGSYACPYTYLAFLLAFYAVGLPLPGLDFSALKQLIPLLDYGELASRLALDSAPLSYLRQVRYLRVRNRSQTTELSPDFTYIRLSRSAALSPDEGIGWKEYQN